MMELLCEEMVTDNITVTDERTGQCEIMVADDGNALCGGCQFMILLLLKKELLSVKGLKLMMELPCVEDGS